MIKLILNYREVIPMAQHVQEKIQCVQKMSAERV